MDAIITIREPDGHEYKIYADGRYEGFKDGAVISNGITSLINWFCGSVIKAMNESLISGNDAANVLLQGLVADFRTMREYYGHLWRKFVSMLPRKGHP